MVFRQLSVKSKLLATVLGMSISSVLIVGVISFTQSQRALSDTVLENLVAQRQARAELIQSFMASIDDEASTLGQDRGVATAIAEFTVAAEQLAGQEPNPAWEEPATEFYAQLIDSLPRSEALAGVTADQYLPRDPAARYLQHYYVVTNPEPDRRQLGDPGDNSFYSRVHSRFHTSFLAVTERFGFTDLYLIEPETNRVVYSVNKGIDFGTSLASGPWGRSALADVVKEVRTQPGARQHDILRLRVLSTLAGQAGCLRRSPGVQPGRSGPARHRRLPDAVGRDRQGHDGGSELDRSRLRADRRGVPRRRRPAHALPVACACRGPRAFPRRQPARRHATRDDPAHHRRGEHGDAPTGPHRRRPARTFRADRYRGRRPAITVASR